MKNYGLAKSKPEKTIKEHTQDLLNQLNILKSIYPDILDKEEWEILELAVKYHDVGKINTKFQNKLYKKLRKELLEDNINGDEIPHNFLSPHLIDVKLIEEKYGRELTKILITSVYYHHNREEKQVTEEALNDLENQIGCLDDFFGLDIKLKKSVGRYILNEKDEEILKSKKYILIKGFLNKLDYVASLGKDGVNVEEKIEDSDGDNVSDKVKKITELKYNNNYRDVQKYMMENPDDNLIVVSYTGSGKTEAALLWIAGSKAFYTLPLKVTINAIYQRIKSDINYSKVLLLHSDAYSFYQEEDNCDINSYDRARRMSAPLIVTTVDQLFKIAFRYNGYEEILATLSYSKIILDEIQMYSPEMLAYIFLGLKMITDIGGKFAIVTATFPPVLYNVMNYLKIPYKKRNALFKPHISNRHKIKIIDEREFDFEYIEKLGKNKKVLVLVNTIKRAQLLNEKLKGSRLLHSHYIKNNRKELEKEILNFGDKNKNQEKGIWISTQIVEASLDIDFDVLFTEMCSIDSLFQRMGRVYRKREYSDDEPNVYVLDNENGLPYVIEPQIYECSINELRKYDDSNLSEEIKQEIINNIYDLEKNEKLKNSYYDIIINEIKLLKNVIPNQLDKKLIDEKFRNIQNISLIPDCIYDELYNNGKIDEWQEILNSEKYNNYQKMNVKNEISNYTINVQYRSWLEIDKEELFYKGSGIHRTAYKYEFNKNTLEGKGLIINKEKRNDNFDY